MTEAQHLIPGDPVADMNARIGVIGQRQEELAQAVGQLGGSVADCGQLRTYVEQMAEVLAGVAKEVAAHDVTMLEDRLDKVAEVAGEVDNLRNEVGTLRHEVQAVTELVGQLVDRRS